MLSKYELFIYTPCLSNTWLKNKYVVNIEIGKNKLSEEKIINI